MIKPISKTPTPFLNLKQEREKGNLQIKKGINKISPSSIKNPEELYIYNSKGIKIPYISNNTLGNF